MYENKNSEKSRVTTVKYLFKQSLETLDNFRDHENKSNAHWYSPTKKMVRSMLL